jgi:predicted negative regulator of RcsB-dependent stress response
LDRITRKELKTDQVSETAFDYLSWASQHRAEMIRYGAIVVVAILAWVGFTIYRSSQATARQEALAKALRLDEATTGANATPTSAHFSTEDEKTKATQAAFGDVAARYNGSTEGAIAEIYLAGAAAEKGDLAQAEKRFKGVVDNAPRDYATLAGVSLAQIYGSEGKTADAEKLLRDIIDRPSSLVSKEQAQLTLAQVLAKSNPEEARKLLLPLTTAAQSRGPIIRAAITLTGELPPPPPGSLGAAPAASGKK